MQTNSNPIGDPCSDLENLFLGLSHFRVAQYQNTPENPLTLIASCNAYNSALSDTIRIAALSQVAPFHLIWERLRHYKRCESFYSAANGRQYLCRYTRNTHPNQQTQSIHAEDRAPCHETEIEISDEPDELSGTFGRIGRTLGGFVGYQYTHRWRGHFHPVGFPEEVALLAEFVKCDNQVCQQPHQAFRQIFEELQRLRGDIVASGVLLKLNSCTLCFKQPALRRLIPCSHRYCSNCTFTLATQVPPICPLCNSNIREDINM